MGPKSRKTVEEDCCFLCKDGGELISCDCTPKFYSKCKPRDKQLVCQKLYHPDCLGFSVPESEKKWMCPRHFCTDCGGYAKNLCFYCPISFCESCSKQKTSFERLKIDAWDQGRKYVGARSYVICSHCRKLESKAVERGSLKSKVPRV